MIIVAIIPLICCIFFGLVHLLVGNKPQTSPTTAKLVTMCLWYSVMAFLVVMLVCAHDAWRIGALR